MYILYIYNLYTVINVLDQEENMTSNSVHENNKHLKFKTGNWYAPFLTAIGQATLGIDN